MRRWACHIAVAAIGVSAAACLQATLTPCADGRACPANLRCDDVHQSCASAQQFAVCAGMPDGTACDADIVSGKCFDGVCLAPGCGNRVVEPGEQCDDGNHIDGDGCSADCKSNETCGNGVVDAVLDEACDDGNLVSNDGCDSRCIVETASWSLVSQAVHAQDDGGAFDAARQMFVFYDGWTWEWDGARWTRRSVTAPPGASSTLIYDPDRAQVVMFVSGGVATWDGATWTVHATTGAGGVGAVTYDSKAHAFRSGIGTALYTLDGATLAWSGPVTMPFSFERHHLVYDAARDRLVAMTSGAQPYGVPPTLVVTWEWDGTNATSTVTSPGADGGEWFLYDPTRQQVISLGGRTSADSQEFTSYYDFNTISAWNGSTWQPVDALPYTGTVIGGAWFDSAAELSTFSWSSANSGGDTAAVWQRQSTAWRRLDPPRPLTLGAIAFDLAGDQLVGLQPAANYVTSATTWTWSATGDWQPVAAAAGQPNNASMALAYDPDRHAIVGYDGTYQVCTAGVGCSTPIAATWLFDGAWTLLAGAGGPPRAVRLQYDFAHRSMMASDGQALWQLPSAGTQWTNLGALPVVDPNLQLAFDTTRGAIIAYATSGTFALVDGTWQRVPSIGAGFALFTLLHQGAQWFVSGATALWQARSDVFTQIDPLPFTGALVEGPRGRVYLYGGHVASAVLYARDLTSATPAETCVAGVDADGDGLAGCADRDCWQVCAPACPPAMSCM